MTTRITLANLEAVVARINRATGSPLSYRSSNPDAPAGGTPSTWHKINIGNYHLDGAYGGYALYRTVNEAGGASDVLRIGHVSKRKLYTAMHAFLAGIDAVQFA